jgi:hypothetical protein
MRSARFTLLALIAFFLFTGISSSQQKRARDNYEFLKLLPKYSNSDALPL